MELGELGAQGLPAAVAEAYGATTVQGLADSLGVSTPPGPEFSAEADAAWRALKAGDVTPARRVLVERLGVSEERADEALAKAPVAVAAFSRPGRHAA